MAETYRHLHRIADLEAENARLQARDNCEDGQGWLSKDVECRRDGFSGPTCHKHAYESLMRFREALQMLWDYTGHSFELDEKEFSVAEFEDRWGYVEEAEQEWGQKIAALTGEPCTCKGPPMQPCGPNCKYPYTDQPWKPLREAADDRS